MRFSWRGEGLVEGSFQRRGVIFINLERGGTCSNKGSKLLIWVLEKIKMHIPRKRVVREKIQIAGQNELAYSNNVLI